MWNGLFVFFQVQEGNMPVPIYSVTDLIGTVLVFEGGTFVWPGLHVNFTRRVSLGSDALSLELVTRSLQPLMIEVSSFVNDVESEHLIKKASRYMQKSPVSLKDVDQGKEAAEFRTSSQYFLPSDDTLTQKLDRRVGALTLTQVSQQEYIQMLRYEFNQRYAAHHDYFDPKDYVGSPDIMQLTSDGRHNRLATVFFYLSTVDSGGETNFPRSGGLPQPLNFEDCSRGVSVQPVRGRIILFYSMDAAAQLDVYSLHGGCAVKSGTKWSANKWIWSKKMNFLKD
jgi:prolyl 4-hydroxylase